MTAGFLLRRGDIPDESQQQNPAPDSKVLIVARMAANIGGKSLSCVQEYAEFQLYVDAMSVLISLLQGEVFSTPLPLLG